MKHLGLLLALLLPSLASAQTISSPQQVAAETVVEESLAARQTRVATEFRTILSKLTLIHERTSAAVTHLNDNSIETVTADKQLTDANTKLALAKTAIDAFAAIPAANAPATSVFRSAAQKSEDALKAARLSIIETLTQLKQTVTPEVTEQ